jgi:hypothetical protein
MGKNLKNNPGVSLALRLASSGMDKVPARPERYLILTRELRQTYQRARQQASGRG